MKAPRKSTQGTFYNVVKYKLFYIFIRLFVDSQICEITRNSEGIRTYSSRS